MEKAVGEKIENLSFDEALESLEEKVRQLEGGHLPLEEALECFKEGIGLVRLCGSKLKNAETTIRQLIHDEEGNIIESPFDGPLGGELD